MTNSPIWLPGADEKANSNLSRFLEFLESEIEVRFLDYKTLHKWSVQNSDLFWELFIRFQNLSYEGALTPVRRSIESVRGFEWFPDLKLNLGLIFLNGMTIDRPIVEVDAQLKRTSVAKEEIELKAKILGWKLRSLRLGKKNAVASVTQNDRNAVISYIGCLLEGLPWCGLSTNVMPENLKSKIDEVHPSVIICDDTTEAFVASLSLRYINVNELFRTHSKGPPLDFDFYAFSNLSTLLFTSGTTGSSKAYFHDCGGFLNQLKDMSLHLDIRPRDVLLLSSNPGWMTWNWLIASLSLGARLVIANFDWPKHLKSYYSLVEDEDVTVFCTSPYFLRQSLAADTLPLEKKVVRSVISTAGPLEKELFQHAQDVFGNIRVSSVSGGSEIASCLVGGNPLLPVFSGEIQCKGLAMDIDFVGVTDEPDGKLKELVVRNRFPCGPAGTLVGRLDEELTKNYYRDPQDDFWYHGDLGYFTENDGLVITSRSDNTLKPKGLRINPMDYYDFFAGHPKVADCLVTSFNENSENHIVLFLKSFKNEAELESQIDIEIRERLGSFYHPRYIFVVSEIPYNSNSKREEIAVKRLLQDFSDGAPQDDLRKYSQNNAHLFIEFLEKLAKRQGEKI